MILFNLPPELHSCGTDESWRFDVEAAGVRWIVSHCPNPPPAPPFPDAPMLLVRELPNGDIPNQSIPPISDREHIAVGAADSPVLAAVLDAIRVLDSRNATEAEWRPLYNEACRLCGFTPR
jgi:hypothetical protein